MNPPNLPQPPQPPQPAQPNYATLQTAFGDIRQSLLTLEARVAIVQQEIGRVANQPTIAGNAAQVTAR